jgi:toxin ParE1/3/4
MTRVVRLLRSAERDIIAGMTWYRTREPGLELEFVSEIDNALNRVSKRPAHDAKRINEYRAVLVRRFPYTIYYRLAGAEIRITAVLHQRRGERARDRRLGMGRDGGGTGR